MAEDTTVLKTDKSSFPLPQLENAAESFKALANAVRTGTLGVDIAENTHHAWVIFGFGLSFVDKHPVLVGGSSQSNEQIAAALELAGVAAAGSASDKGAIPWAIILPLVLQLIEKFVKK